VAVAVAVLAGALLVGQSVRASLRQLATARLGNTDQAILSTGFFRAGLASELGIPAVPVLALEGIVTHEQSGTRAAKVLVYGVDERFWTFHGVEIGAMADREAFLGEPLAKELGAKPGDTVLVRLPQPSDIPVESLHGRKEDAGRTIRFIAGAPVPSPVGEFTLRPRQGTVRAAFVPLRRLQRDLKYVGRVNTIIVAGNQPLDAALKRRYQLADLGIKLRPLDPENGFAVETDSAILSESLGSAVLETARTSGLRTSPVFSYLANAIRANGREVPYSLVTAMHLEIMEQPDGIVLNDWTARELAAKPGDVVTLEYYVWQSDGNLLTKTASFRLNQVLPMKGIAADRNLAPEYPGISDAATIGDWDPPFPMDLKRIRPADEAYWNRYRATPKAFLPLARGQRLWGSRFGKLTSIRIAGDAPEAFGAALRDKLNPLEHGLSVDRVRERAIAASAGATDFGEYFTYFSFFLVISSLLLTGLFFRLGVEQRLREAGTLRATGFPASKVGRLFAAEGFVLALFGGLAGVGGALLYAWLIVFGLRTWWVDAVGTTLLRVHPQPSALIGGVAGGLLAAAAAILLSLRAIRRRSPRSLLSGVSEPGLEAAARRTRALIGAAAAGLLALTLIGFGFARPTMAGAFFGGGGLLLIAALLWQWAWLAAPRHRMLHGVRALGFRGTHYRPGRSVLCIALIAFATFLIVGVDAFRRGSSPASLDPKSGNGGFSLIAESAIPLVYDLNSPAGRESLGLTGTILRSPKYVALRLRPGDDTSCLNLYQPAKPRILGVPAALTHSGRFEFQSALQGPVDKAWRLIDRPILSGVVPAIVDANSLTYVLHRKLGDEMVLENEGSQPIRLQFVATLKDSIFQSEILIAESNFTRLFPGQQGYRYYLIDAAPNQTAEVTQALENGLAEYGFDVEQAGERLAAFHRVENTYLSTFQTLGGLGLVLGTVGLGAVLLRNILERRREIALLRAVGYRPDHLKRLVLAENVFLLISGLAIGSVCALIAIAPAWLERGGRIPILSIAALLGVVFLTGVAASFVAVRAVRRAPIAAALRAE
jgi:ABC-type lipoprotein release transport system permease subunit